MRTRIARIASWTVRTLALSVVVASVAYAQGIVVQLPGVQEDGVMSWPTVLTEAAGVNPIAPSDIPADTIDNVNKLTSGIRTGNGSKVTTWEGATTASRCVRTNANGNAEVASGDCAVANYAPVHTLSATPLSDGNVTVYISLAGGVSTSATDIRGQSLCGAATYRDLRVGLSEDCTSCTVVFQTGTFGGTLSASSLTVSPTTGETPVADTTNTASTTANQGCQYKMTKTSAAADFWFVATVEKSQN